jgi:acetyl-CoA acyltransferase
VVLGCVTQVGEQSGNIDRTAALSAGWPESIPGVTVDRKCGSGKVTVHLAASMISAGMRDIVIAGGAESMSRVPMGGNRDVHGAVFGWALTERFPQVSQGEGAERIAEGWNIQHAEMEAFAVRSHYRAAAAQEAGWFKREIVPVPVARWSETRDAAAPEFARDETIRPGTLASKLAALQPSFRPEGGRLTTGTCC